MLENETKQKLPVTREPENG